MSKKDDTREIIMARRQFFITSALAGVALAACDRGSSRVCLNVAPVRTEQPTEQPAGQPTETAPPSQPSSAPSFATPAPSTTTSSAATVSPPVLPPSVCLEMAPSPRACLDVAPPNDSD